MASASKQNPSSSKPPRHPFTVLASIPTKPGAGENPQFQNPSTNFLGDPVATYSVADTIAKSEDESVPSELKTFLQEHWSEAALNQGVRESSENFMNFMRVLKIGESAIRLRDLPGPLRVAVAYMPLYRECVKAGGRLLSQRLRGQLMEAARQLQGLDVVDTEEVYKGEHHHQLMAVLEHHLPLFLVKASSH